MSTVFKVNAICIATTSMLTGRRTDMSVLFAGVVSHRLVMKLPSARFDSVRGISSCTEISYLCCGTRVGSEICAYGCEPSLPKSNYEYLRQNRKGCAPIL